jgi:hypothetical protein
MVQPSENVRGPALANSRKKEVREAIQLADARVRRVVPPAGILAIADKIHILEIQEQGSMI